MKESLDRDCIGHGVRTSRASAQGSAAYPESRAFLEGL